MLHVGVCYKSFSNQVLLKGSKELDITGREVGTVGRAVHDSPVIVTDLVASLGTVIPICVRCRRKHVVGERSEASPYLVAIDT